MLRFLYKTASFPFRFYNYIFNYLLLKITNTEINNFPIIYGRIVRRGPGRLLIRNEVKINSATHPNPVGMGRKSMFYIGPKGVVQIGNGVGITNTLFFAEANITLEDNVLIGGGCQILDNDFHPLNAKNRISRGTDVKAADILIKEGAFIGTSSIILKGVTIGERSIVAAGSVVVKSIPADEIWGGNPAKFIRKMDS